MTTDNASSPKPETPEQLAEFRRQIDDLDDKIIELLKTRMGVVSQVGKMKNVSSPGQCPLRPGREADMVRRVTDKFRDSDFPPAAAAAIWRTLIGASTAVEGSLRISVYGAEKDESLYWLAREYFGPFISVTRQSHVNRVIGDVMDGKTAVGLLPAIRSSDTTHWWTTLMQSSDNVPKIFAHVPFVYFDKPGNNTLSGLAIARITPEQTADDLSVIVLEADHNVSQNRMQSAFGEVKLDAKWLQIASLKPSARHHVIELKGFITPDHKGMKDFLAALGNSILHTTYLGSYAAPFTLSFSNEEQQPHAAKA